MFFRMFFLVWTGLHLYVIWRASATRGITRFVPKKYLVALGGMLWVGFFLPRLFENFGADSAAGFAELLSMIWLGTLFLVFVCLLTVDLITIFGFSLRKYVPTLRVFGFIAGLALSAFALVQGLRPPVISDYDIRLPNLPKSDDGLVMAVISDTHVGALIGEDWLAGRIEQIKALKPDVVVFLGDIFEGDSQNERGATMIPLLRSLSPRFGSWGVMGNHEYHADIDSSVNFFKSAGIRILRGNWVEITPGVYLGGIDDGHEHYMAAETPNRLQRTLESKPSGVATIFLSHRPLGVEKVAAAGVGLMLSGHTHGGQIWPFSYISVYVNRYLSGRYDIDGMPIIVSRGAGTWGPRMRLWSPGEILRITLHCEGGS